MRLDLLVEIVQPYIHLRLSSNFYLMIFASSHVCGEAIKIFYRLPYDTDRCVSRTAHSGVISCNNSSKNICYHFHSNKTAHNGFKLPIKYLLLNDAYISLDFGKLVGMLCLKKRPEKREKSPSL